MDLVRVNFVSPFVTNVVVKPDVLLRKGVRKTQEDIAEALQKLCPLLPFKDQMSKRWTCGADSGVDSGLYARLHTTPKRSFAL